MDNRNMSDIIENYLKNILSTHNAIEIKRSEMANLFDCVPSQINYVINTRFTVLNGYKVESKRGGGGYIRIVKVNLLQHSDYVQAFSDVIGSDLTESEAFAILKQLHDNDIITLREKYLLEALFKSKGLTKSSEERSIRAQLMLDLLERLAYEE